MDGVGIRDLPVPCAYSACQQGDCSRYGVELDIRSVCFEYLINDPAVLLIQGTGWMHLREHKVGEDDDDVHDAAIITNGQHYVILVIFTDGNGVYDWGARAQLMQTVAREVSAAYL